MRVATFLAIAALGAAAACAADEAAYAWRHTRQAAPAPALAAMAPFQAKPDPDARFARELDRLPVLLADKAREILMACPGTHILIVHDGHTTNVLHTRRTSLHTVWKALDLQGNPACIYAHLRGRWAGGYSTDYDVVGHVHVSYAPGSHEFGRTFIHGGHGGHKRARK